MDTSCVLTALIIPSSCYAEGMDRATLQRQLVETEKKIASGQHQIAGQRETIAELERNGRPTDHAKYLLAGFILFRVFDIWKPFPARQAEALHGGLGIMADDWVAGFYAALVLWLLRYVGA